MMSNLENLTKKILDDANSQASIIQEESKEESRKTIESRIKQAEEEKKRILSRATSEADLLKSRTISNAELSARDEKLTAKQEVIERVFNLAKEKLKNLKEEEYLAYLKATLEDIKLEGGETIIVPERMKAKVKELGLSAKVSEETVDSGFVIKDGGIILNHTFDSLVDDIRDDLEIEIAQSLFKE